MLKEGWEIFIRNLEELEANEGKETEVEIRDVQTYRSRAVKAIITRAAETPAAEETLWCRALVGHLLDERPWRIKITEVIEER